ncbi:hypothetical protein BGW38_002750, partial [Lunasporangiospora selenospora]
MPSRTESESPPASLRAPSSPSPVKAKTPAISHHDLHPLVMARAYGAVASLYLWSIWCCDHYQLNLVYSAVIVISGAWLLWTIYPSTTNKMPTMITSSVSLDLSRPSAAAATRLQEAMPSPSPASSVSTAALPPSSSSAAISVKACDIAKGETAARDDRDQETSGAIIAEDAGVQQSVDNSGDWAFHRLSLPESPVLPCEPPPPYDKARASHLGNTAQGQGKSKDLSRQYLWTIFTIQGLGICGCLLFLGVQSLLPWVLTWEEELMLWTGAGVFYIILVYTAWCRLGRSSGFGSSAQAEPLELQDAAWSKSGVRAQLESGSVSSESSIKSALSQESLKLGKNGRRNPTQSPGQQEEELRHAHLRPPQLLAVSSSEVSKTLSPLPAPSNRSSLTFSLRSLKHEIHMWALSMFYLAPVIPKCLSHHCSGPMLAETFQSDQQHGKDGIETEDIISALDINDIPAGDQVLSQDLPSTSPQGRPQWTIVQTKRVYRKNTSEPRMPMLTVSPTSTSPTGSSPTSPTTLSRLTRMALDT